jgi:GDP-4-dehydro-6-deoxy-D-mannose reductase
VTTLLTGATGFLGRAARPLLSGRVIAVSSRDADLTSPAQALALVSRVKPDRVLHLAGSPRKGGEAHQWRAHLGATVNLLEALRTLPKAPRVLVVGSAAELQALTPYGQSKRAATLAALSYNNAGVPVIGARLYNVLGPGTPSDLAFGAFAQKLSTGKKTLVTGGLSGIRDFLDVRDAARALVLLLRKGEPGRVYDVCSGKPVLMRSAVKRLMALSGGGARLEEGSGSGVARAVGNPTALKALGFKPRYTLEQSLSATLR